MKCLILAGGRGEGLWPLSRKNYPKQFIQIQKNHSVFQETVARNIPYCDEFIIITSYEYRYIIDNQMKAFQGISYRCIYEEEPRNTTAALILACLSLQPSEYIFVVAADHLINTQTESCGDLKGYKDAILQGKEYANSQKIVLFGKEQNEFDSRYGNIINVSADGNFQFYFEKPSEKLSGYNNIFRSLGLFLFINGAFLNIARNTCPDVYKECVAAHKKRLVNSNYEYYNKEVQQEITSVSIEESIITKTKEQKMVNCCFEWNDVGSFEDLKTTEYHTDGINITHECNNTVVVNNASRQIVVVNKLDNALVVNTPDAVYVGEYGNSENVKELLNTYSELTQYGDKGTIFHRSWGYYENLVETPQYRIRQVFLYPGKTIHTHKHDYRSENWTVVKGQATITVDGVRKTCNVKDNIDIPEGINHKISNPSDELVIFVETAVGEILHGGDIISETSGDIDEIRQYVKSEPMVKLKPVFKDYLWGGTQLRDVYHKKCDFDIIAESWELSAHQDGQCIVDSGKKKGMSFGEYLDEIGKDILGWKCSPLQAFPLLIKFIDAKDNLSLQVHPNDDYALKQENQYGKNEMWYVISAEEGAGLYVGFNKDVTKDEIQNRIKNNTIMDVLNFFPTKAGDVFFIPAGTVHAIGAGNVICEIQQSSNCTYRLYDFNRRDKFGNLRELHLQKALDVLDCKKYVPVDFEVDKNTSGEILSRCKYFEAVIYDISESEKIVLEDDSFYAVVCIKGSGILKILDTSIDIKAGESVFIPAQNESLLIEGEMTMVLSHI